MGGGQPQPDSKAISNKATQTQNAACTVYLGNQKPLQQKTQRGYAFCAPAAPKRKKASSLNDDANLWRARSGGPRSVERPAARRAAWSGRPLLLPGRRAVASPSTSLVDSAALDGAVSSARRARYGEPPVLPGESAAGGRDGERVDARSGVGRGCGQRGEEQRAHAGGAAGARARRRRRAEPVLAGDAAGACVDLVLPGPAGRRRAGTAAAPSALVAGVRPPPPLRSPRRRRRRGRMGRLWLLEKGENGSSPFLLLAPQTTKWVLGLSAHHWRQS